jgi:hypothetical protein
MEQTKTYKTAMFKGDARNQFEKDSKKLAKDGWKVHSVTDQGVGAGQNHTGVLKVVYVK